MRIDETTYQTIDAYLKGELREEQKLRFEEQLKSNADLRNEVQMVALANEVVVDYSLAGVKADLRKIHNRKPTNPWFIVAGLFGAALMLGFLINSFQDKPVSSNPEIEQNIVAIDTVANETLVEPVEENEEVQRVEETPVTIIEKNEEELKVNNKPERVVSPTVTETEKVEVVENTTVKVSCDEVHISASLIIENTCLDKQTGSVLIETNTVEGGTAPYEYALISSKERIRKKDIPFSKENTYAELSEGYYSVFIKDKNGCISYSPKAALVASAVCEHTTEEVFLNLGDKDSWEIQKDNAKSGKVRILNEEGELLYERPFSEQEQLIWYGKGDNGQPLESGQYLFEIKYEDGHSLSGPIRIK